MPPELILDPAELDLSQVIADREAIRRYNAQRYEMEQLTAVVLIDPERQLIAGYKDVTESEFWVRGHMPGFPLMPGVIMCEAAAQLTSYYVHDQNIFKGEITALAGLENVSFRAPVRPGDRMVLVGHGVKMSTRLTVFAVQGFVDGAMAFHCEVKGVPLRRGDELRGG